MYPTLLFLHSILRWLVVISLLYAVIISYRGYKNKLPFTKHDNAARHWTATIAHIQLIIGMLLYFQSPIIKYFWKHFPEAVSNIEMLFFGLLHILLMLMAIVILTVGSAMARRKPSDPEKFKTMLAYFAISLVLIFVAIPWPFSPLAHRPFLR